MLLGIPGWRQFPHTIRKIKSHLRKIQKLKRSTSKDSVKIAKRDHEIRQLNRSYLARVEEVLSRVQNSIQKIRQHSDDCNGQLSVITTFIRHAERQVNQISRRIFDDEKIPHTEKVFSVFKEHTEWISKGKAEVPQEFGLRVAVMTDQ